MPRLRAHDSLRSSPRSEFSEEYASARVRSSRDAVQHCMDTPLPRWKLFFLNSGDREAELQQMIRLIGGVGMTGPLGRACQHSAEHVHRGGHKHLSPRPPRMVVTQANST